MCVLIVCSLIHHKSGNGPSNIGHNHLEQLSTLSALFQYVIICLAAGFIKMSYSASRLTWTVWLVDILMEHESRVAIWFQVKNPDKSVEGKVVVTHDGFMNGELMYSVSHDYLHLQLNVNTYSCLLSYFKIEVYFHLGHHRSFSYDVEL